MGNKHPKPRSASSSSTSRPKSGDDGFTRTSAAAQYAQSTPAVPAPAAQRSPPQQPAVTTPSIAYATPPPAPPQHQYTAPAARSGAPPSKPPRHAPTNSMSLLESKMSQLDIAAIFSPQEIQAIRKHLAALLGQHENDAVVIPREEFFPFLGTTSSSMYVNRLYGVFDMAGKGYVTFEDLIKGLAILSQKASREQKLMLSFHLLDPEGTGYITKKMTTELLRSCLAESKGELDIYLSDEQIKQIVDFTFEEADLDRNNLVDLREYQALDAKHPGLFDFLTVDALSALNHLERVHSMSMGGASTGAEY